MFLDLLKARWLPILALLGCAVLAAVFGIAAPYFQKEFIDQLVGIESKINLGFSFTPQLAIILGFFAVLGQLIFNQLTSYLGFLESIHMQRTLSQKIYDKMFSLNLESQSKRPIGEMVSLYATDVSGATILLEQTIPQGVSTFIPLIISPFAISFLFQIPVWPIVLTMFAITALSLALAYRQATFFFLFKTLAAERIGLVNEWIQNIRTFKILTWLESFEALIFKKRQTETANRVSMVTNGQTMNAFSSTITFFLNLLAIYLYVENHRNPAGELSLSQVISPGEILAMLWIVGVFLTRPFRQMPWFFTFAFDSWTSTKRIQSFLQAANSETPKLLPTSHKIAPASNDLALNVVGLSLVADQRWILRDISFTLKKNQKVALVGEIGSGKSMLLYSLLGETGASFQKYEVLGQSSPEKRRRQFSFVSQEGFVLSATLAQNVIFDFEKTDAQRSDIVESLKKAELSADLQSLPCGLDTEIGERGVNMSGGQRQRVNIARGFFHQAPILILDDCFSALDVDTERKLVQTLFQTDFSNQTLLIATHRLSLLDHVDEVIFLEQGQIKAQGSYRYLKESNEDFRKFTESTEVR